MKIKTPKRIAIIGLPGSGKSTFASKLSKLLNIPVHHLDKCVFIEGGKKRDHQELVNIQQAMVDQDSWIIEGCSIKTLDIRFARADTVIYLQLPRFFCMRRVLKRFFIFDEYLANTGCVRIANWALLKYIWNFNKDKTQKIEETKDRYPNSHFHVLANSWQIEKFLKEQR